MKTLLLVPVLLVLLFITPCIDGKIEPMMTVYSRSLPAQTISSPISLSGDSDPDWALFNGTGTSNDPFRIEGLTIHLAESENTAIHIEYTNMYWVIRNCTLTGYYDINQSPHTTGNGIWLLSTHNGRIENCTFNAFRNYVRLWDSNNVTIRTNRLSGVFETPYGNIGTGIESQTCQSLVVEENKIANVNDAMVLWSSNQSYVHGNTLSNCTSGILYRNPHDPQQPTRAVNSTFVENIISDCRYTGLTIQNGRFNYIKQNIILRCSLYGVDIDDWSHNTTVLNNTLAANSPAGIHIGDSGLSNGSASNIIVNNSLVLNTVNALNDVPGNLYDYNYYSDYTGVDENGDMIGDTPYLINGSSPTQDIHPRVYTVHNTTTTTTPVTTTTSTSEATTVTPPESSLLIAAGVSTISLISAAVIAIMARKRRFGHKSDSGSPA